jgi:hypothetical protein
MLCKENIHSLQSNHSLSSVTMHWWPCDSSQSPMPKALSKQPTKLVFDQILKIKKKLKPIE